MDSKVRPESTVPALAGRRLPLAQPALVATSNALVPVTGGDSAAGTFNIVQAFLRVLVHHWWKILGIWIVVSAGLAYLIHVKVKPSYEAFSLLRVEPAQHDLFGLGLDSAEAFDHFLQTQVQLITSPNVLLAALTDREVNATEVLRESKDPENELRRRLQVGVVPGTYLIRVALTVTKADEAALIVNKVVKAYVDVANSWSTEKNTFQIARLQKYNSELGDKVTAQEEEWLKLAANSNVDPEDLAASTLSLRNSNTNTSQTSQTRVSIDEYKKAREELFQIRLDLIEAEALLATRQADMKSRTAGVDPEVIMQRRIDDELQHDDEIHDLALKIEQARVKIERVSRLTRSPMDPSLREAQRQVSYLQGRYKQLYIQKRDELTERYRDQPLDDGSSGQSLRELVAQIDAMKVRKGSYEDLLKKMEVTNRQQGTDAVRVALVRENLSSLRGMQEAVHRRIEQLNFDSRGEARIKQITEARPSRMPLSDGRKKLWTVAPVGVMTLLLGLFLFMEIRSKRVADIEEVSRRLPVEVYAVPSLPGTPKSSDQKALRASETQLQEFLQSLDHLRVSLWFGQEATAGSGRCLAITSAVGGEGKTTLSAHLAVCCAKAGISTLVIDADLRRGSLSRMFEEEQSPGLSDVLKGELSPEDAVIALRDGGFHLLPAGTPGQNPGWLLREQRVGQTLARYREMFDLVIIDTPPVLPVPDALSLGPWIDGAVLVIRYDESRFPLVDRARNRLVTAGVPILKTVVNGVKNSRFRYGSGYFYGSAYGGVYGERAVTTDAQESTPS